VSKIAWTDGTEGSPWRCPTFYGMIGGLSVATVINRRGEGWGLIVYLAPLPDRLDRLTLSDKATAQQAKATAQRVVNAYLKILNGEGPA
jgi:hypothetical protein